MTIKDLAYAAQQHVQASTGCSFKRTHIYELLAAFFGFDSYAAFGVNTVLAERRHSDTAATPQVALIKRRCVELGYQPDTATLATSALQSFLSHKQIGIASISSLVSSRRPRWHNEDYELDDDENDRSEPTPEAFGPILLDGLDVAARRGNAQAHYALALIYASEEEDDPHAGSPYWYEQRQQGRVLTGVEEEWAEAHAFQLACAEKYAHHLREAGRLGHQQALLDLAKQFDDPSFFDQRRHDIDADPIAVAAIAERLGRPADAKHWLTLAAESGDTAAMLQLIEEWEHDDLQLCWKWVYLSRLLGMDLTQDAHFAINEDGSDYDDDVGGPAYVAGRDGVDLEPLPAEQDATARFAAQKLFEQIKQNAD